MRIYESGWQATNAEREAAVIAAGGLKHRCFSFASARPIPGMSGYIKHLQGAIDACITGGVGIMMDSGVHGFRNYREKLLAEGKSIEKLATEAQYIKLYVDYVKENKHNWDWYVTVDLDRNAANIYQRHLKVLKMGINPVPVFHGDSSTDYIRRYWEEHGHKLQCLATWKALRTNKKKFRSYLDACFNLGAKYNLDFHGLAFTSPYLMLEYPWWSVDSSSWSRAAGYGSIMRFDPETCRMSTIHVSTHQSMGSGTEYKQNKLAVAHLKKELAAEGYDYKQLQEDFVLRHIYNSHTMLRITEEAEKRYAKKGKWNLLF